MICAAYDTRPGRALGRSLASPLLSPLYPARRGVRFAPLCRFPPYLFTFKDVCRDLVACCSRVRGRGRLRALMPGARSPSPCLSAGGCRSRFQRHRVAHAVVVGGFPLSLRFPVPGCLSVTLIVSSCAVGALLLMPCPGSRLAALPACGFASLPGGLRHCSF